jgi:hypothetical protein
VTTGHGPKVQSAWTIEHALPQGANLPAAWIKVLSGAAAATDAQEVEVHRLRNLTITACNSTLSNKSFTGQARAGRLGRPLHRGYRNGLSLNSSLAAKESWTVPDIDARTDELANELIGRFRL